jgi:hypothetical protein
MNLRLDRRGRERPHAHLFRVQRQQIAQRRQRRQRRAVHGAPFSTA